LQPRPRESRTLWFDPFRQVEIDFAISERNTLPFPTPKIGFAWLCVKRTHDVVASGSERDHDSLNASRLFFHGSSSSSVEFGQWLSHARVGFPERSDSMRGDKIWLLGIGIQAPSQLVDQHLDTSKQPHKLRLQVEGERGARYPCPQCGTLCPAHDFHEKRWRATWSM
jgi:hypothetical protein